MHRLVADVLLRVLSGAAFQAGVGAAEDSCPALDDVGGAVVEARHQELGWGETDDDGSVGLAVDVVGRRHRLRLGSCEGVRGGDEQVGALKLAISVAKKVLDRS